jgi:hypothetical protein
MTRRPPIADWPERDRALWEKGVEPKGLFEGGGVGAGWSDASRFKTARGYRHWLLWLTAQGPCDLNSSAADRVTRERVAGYVAELRPLCAPYTVLCRIRELYDAMRVMAPETDWDWLSELHCTLSAGVRPVRDKLPRLRPIGELDDLGQRLMDEPKPPPDGRRGGGPFCFAMALLSPCSPVGRCASKTSP